MKHTIELEEKDIKKIISKEFDVHENQITIFTRTVTRGHGYREYDEEQVYIKVEKTTEV